MLVVAYELHCDQCEAVKIYTYGVARPSSEYIRRCAKLDGWVFREPLDLCPACNPKRQAAKKDEVAQHDR